jgi:hypothetical protein
MRRCLRDFYAVGTPMASSNHLLLDAADRQHQATQAATSKHHHNHPKATIHSAAFRWVHRPSFLTKRGRDIYAPLPAGLLCGRHSYGFDQPQSNAGEGRGSTVSAW